MPQKKNPDLLELVRGKAGRVVGAATSLLMTVKGLPLAYNKDLQETQEPLFDATGTVLCLLPLVTAFMREVEFDLARMQQRAQSGYMNAWAAATYLVEHGVPSRLAHEQVGAAVKLCLERACALEELPLVDWQTINPVIGGDIFRQLTLEAVLSIHDVPGGTGPGQVRRALARASERVVQLREEIHAHA